MMPAPLRADDLPALVAQQLIRTCQLAQVSRTQLAFYCAAVGVTDPIHYESTFARQAGFADNVVNGSLRVAWRGDGPAGYREDGALPQPGAM